MSYTSYICPVCGDSIVRDVARFLQHTNQHIVAKIRSRHPEYVEADGSCPKCGDYLKTELSVA